MNKVKWCTAGSLVALLISSQVRTARAATVIQTYMSGTIASGSDTDNTDTFGLFGPPGGSLSGAPITVLEQYVPADLVVNKNSTATGNYVPKTGANIAGAILLVVTVNGVQRVAVSSQGGNVVFQSNPSSYGVDATSANTTTGIQVPTSTQPAFGKPTPPISMGGQNSGYFFFYNAQGQEEPLFFSVTSQAN